MTARRSTWFTIRQPLTGRRATIAKIAAFLLPLLTWCVVSYVPFVWHPDVYITDPGDSDFLTAGQQLPKDQFAAENAKLRGEHQAEAKGYPANPIFLPAPHEVVKAFYKAFTTPPAFHGDPWLHQSLWHSIQIIFWGFVT